MAESIAELVFPDDIHYFHEHTWAKVEHGLVRVGITDFAQDSLGDLIFVELPNVGEVFSQGDECGEVESAKTASALYIPIGGEIVKVNEDLEEDPERVNQEPYGAGWMLVVKPDNIDEVNGLMSKEDYLNQIKE